MRKNRLNPKRRRKLKAKIRAAAQERERILRENLSTELGDTPRSSGMRSATTRLREAASFGWEFDAKGNPKNIRTVINPVGSKR